MSQIHPFPFASYNHGRITGQIAPAPTGWHTPARPLSYFDPCYPRLVTSCPCGGSTCARCQAQRFDARYRQGVGELPPASPESAQAQVSGQYSQRLVVVGVLAVLAAAAVIYSGRKGAFAQ